MTTTELSVFALAAPKPGKCLAVPSTPPARSPAAKARARVLTVAVERPKLRPSCSISEPGRATSTTGARSTLTPADRSVRAVARPSLRAIAAEVICGGERSGAPGSRLTSPPSWSVITSSGAVSPVGRRIACSSPVSRRTCAIEATLSPNRITPAAWPRAIRLRRLTGISVPENANTTRCPASWIELRAAAGAATEREGTSANTGRQRYGPRMADIEVRRDDLRTTREVPGESRAEAAGPGEVQLAIDAFGLSANNVTYGVLGDGMSYWNFFPASEAGWGRVPVWGFGDVVASAVDGIEPGERFYGYFPMSSLLTVRAEPRSTGFSDAAEHRRELPAVYNEYVRTPRDAPHQDETMLLRPLFATAFAIDAFLADHGAFGADAIVLSSASSKTAYSLAYLLAQHEYGPSVIGLTSPGNLAFVEALGVYDAVVAYDEIEDAAGDSTLVYVDMS